MNLESRQIGDLVIRLQACFLEHPDLALTLQQAEQVSGADEITCRAIVDLLIEGGVIARTGEGRYVRRIPPPRSWSDRQRFSARPGRVAFRHPALVG